MTMIAWAETNADGKGDGGGCVTSDSLATSVGTNPVVVRRILARLQEAGLIVSKRGPGGGSVLARDPKQITLRQLYEAVGDDDQLLLGRNAHEDEAVCPLAPVVASCIEDVLGAAEEALLHHLASVTIDAVSRSVADRFERRNRLLGDSPGPAHRLAHSIRGKSRS